jgi:hypothetical protein
VLIADARTDQRSAPANTFRVDVRIAFIDAGIGQGSDQATRYTARGSSHESSDQPARADHRSDSGYRKGAQSSQKPTDTSDGGANSGSFGRSTPRVSFGSNESDVVTRYACIL